MFYNDLTVATVASRDMLVFTVFLHLLSLEAKATLSEIPPHLEDKKRDERGKTRCEGNRFQRLLM